MGEGVDGWVGVRRGRMGFEFVYVDNGFLFFLGCRVFLDGYLFDLWLFVLVLWLYLWVSL